MATLKDLRGRINSVKSTRKITSAMKMVAASKLRRAQAAAEAARPYAERMAGMLSRLAANVAGSPGAPRLLVGTGKDQVHLVIAMTADRGLAGAFSSGVGRQTVKILAVGRKGRDYLKREFAENMSGDQMLGGRKTIEFAQAKDLANTVFEMFERGEFDVATLVYNRFKSVIAQIPTEVQIIPLPLPEISQEGGSGLKAVYEFEPDEETILLRLLPQNLAVQIYRAMLESNAGFYGAQMTSMDNATRNAGDMILRLTQNYNRTRQANITRELIEIISGAEAL
jgi:F-type H+-transporting ATPase subunit gamma